MSVIFFEVRSILGFVSNGGKILGTESGPLVTQVPKTRIDTPKKSAAVDTSGDARMTLKQYGRAYLVG